MYVKILYNMYIFWKTINLLTMQLYVIKIFRRYITVWCVLFVIYVYKYKILHIGMYYIRVGNV